MSEQRPTTSSATNAEQAASSTSGPTMDDASGETAAMPGTVTSLCTASPQGALVLHAEQLIHAAAAAAVVNPPLPYFSAMFAAPSYDSTIGSVPPIPELSCSTQRPPGLSGSTADGYARHLHPLAAPLHPILNGESDSEQEPAVTPHDVQHNTRHHKHQRRRQSPSPSGQQQQHVMSSAYPYTL